MDYLDIVPQLEFISSLFTNGNDMDRKGNEDGTARCSPTQWIQFSKMNFRRYKLEKLKKFNC